MLSSRTATSLTVFSVKFRLVDAAGLASVKVYVPPLSVHDPKSIVKFAEKSSDASCVKVLMCACDAGTEGVVHRSSLAAPLPDIRKPF